MAFNLNLKNSRWKTIAGYAAFSLASFIFFLYLTFPYEAVRDRVTVEAGAAGWNVKLGSLGPGLFGVTAKRVELSRRTPAPAGLEGTGAPAAPGGPLVLASVSARPALFPPGIAYRANAFGGVISGSVGGLGDLKVNLELDRLDPSDGSLKAMSGVEAAGLLNGDVSFSIPREEGSGPTRGYDLSKANGQVALQLSQALIKGGTVTVPLPMYGNQPTPVDLPRIALGDVEARLKFDQGKGTLERLRAKSDDLEINCSGTVNLAKRPDYSELNLELKIKAEEEFRKRLGPFSMAISALPPDKADQSFRVATLSGFLGRPNFIPGSRK